MDATKIHDGILLFRFPNIFSDLTHLPHVVPGNQPCLRLDTVLGQLKELDRQRCEAAKNLGPGFGSKKVPQR